MRTYEKCLELDIPVLFHVGWHNAGSANPSAAANGANSCKYSCVGTPFEFANVLETFPELKVIFAHMGAENYFRCLGMAQRFHNVYMDTAWLEHYGSNQLPHQFFQPLFPGGFQMIIHPGHAPAHQNLPVGNKSLIYQLIKHRIQ